MKINSDLTLNSMTCYHTWLFASVASSQDQWSQLGVNIFFSSISSFIASFGTEYRT